MVVVEVGESLEEEAARATPSQLTQSRPTAKASNRAMACCTSRSLAKQATTSRTPIALRVLLVNTIPLLAAHPLRIAKRVPATLTLQQALPLALLRVRAGRRYRLALRAHAAKLAIMLRAARVFYVLQAV